MHVPETGNDIVVDLESNADAVEDVGRYTTRRDGTLNHANPWNAGEGAKGYI